MFKIPSIGYKREILFYTSLDFFNIAAGYVCKNRRFDVVNLPCLKQNFLALARSWKFVHALNLANFLTFAAKFIHRIK